MEKLRFGFVGAGGITHGHAKRLTATEEAEVVAVAEPDAASATRFEQATGLHPRVYPSLEAMLAAERLDCALIASPHTLHFAQSKAALEAGLHVLSEKPMVTTTRDAQTLIDLSARVGRVLMIAYQRHLEPTFLWLKQQLASGVMGRITFVSALSCQEWLQLTAGTWRQDPALSGGGQINDTGSHFIDVLTWLAGPVTEVHAFMDNRGTRVDINSAVAFRFASGALGSLTVVGDAHRWWEDWTISCERGTIFLRDGRLFKAVLGQPLQEVPAGELPAAVGDVDRAFVEAVRGRAPVPVPPSIGLGVIQLTEAAWRSAQEGRPIRVSEL
jgi:predicted dehydrogenase